MINDSEMRDIFRVESSEHLQALDDGLLRLEKDPLNRAILEELFREAHSLKGASRMLGLPDIEVVSHRLEDLLGGAHRNEAPLTPERIELLYSSLDALRKLCEEALTGATSGVIVSEVLARLKSAGAAPPEFPPPLQNHEPHPPPDLPSFDFAQDRLAEGGTTNSRLALKSAAGEAPAEPAPHPDRSTARPFQIETVRVETRKLDLLMTQTAELAVARQRITRRGAQVEELLTAWERLAGTFRNPSGQQANRMTGVEQFTDSLERLKAAIYDDSSRLEAASRELEDGVRAIRLIPLTTIFSLFPRMVRDLATEQGKEADLVIVGGETAADKRIIEEIKDPLMHIIRNAVDHGIEPPDVRERLGKRRRGTILLRADRGEANIGIEVCDDGRGLDTDAIRRSALKRRRRREDELATMSPDQLQALIFESGLSTSSFVSDVSGRGVGLDVVRAGVERLKGQVAVESAPGAGCTIRIRLPVSLATARVLIIAAGGLTYALPVENVLKSFPIGKRDHFSIDGRGAVTFEEQAISAVKLSDLLPVRRTDFLPRSEKAVAGDARGASQIVPCIVIAEGGERLGLLVDELLDEQEIFLKPQCPFLRHVRNLSGSTILGTGEVCMVLDPRELILSVRRQGVTAILPAADDEAERRKVILLVDDSMTTRIQLKRILEGAGYDVVPAVDGLDAFTTLGSRAFDALVTDITMPNMDGLTLTAKVREDRKYRDLPIILVTMLASDDDRRRGVAAGANAYITKPAFDQKLLLDTLRRLV